ncbi:uncharacterized protein DEA37_0003192 [Paragonimus westermani]|uniref:Uncharacterized protein n=1 Tax=Paragonimus westermani TaxID=34504 RepID=A0A5J4NRV7_9TREM|nr:uncharacterized protein DEA37_0003192 [Paragonimus westermani]
MNEEESENETAVKRLSKYSRGAVSKMRVKSLIVAGQDGKRTRFSSILYTDNGTSERSTKHPDITILAVDLNAQLGHLPSNENRLGGMFGVQAQRNDNSEKLLQLCASHGLHISNTASQHKKKQYVTCRLPCASQPWTQLDHIAIS